MKSKILVLLALGMFGLSIAADASIVVTTNGATEFSGTFAFTTGEFDFAFSSGKLLPGG